MVAGFTATWPAWLSFAAAERAVWATCEDIVALLPETLRYRVVPRSKVVLLDVPEDGLGIDVVLPDGREMKIKASDDVSELQSAAKRHFVVVRLSEAEILSTALMLPRRLLSRLDEVITTNIPVWTPFAAEELYFKARVSRTQTAPGDDARRPTCEVELRCAPKAALASRLSRLAARSIEIDELWLSLDNSFSCDLGSKKTRRAGRRKRAILILVGLVMVQAYALSSVYRMRQDEQITTLQGELAQMRQALQAQVQQVKVDRDTNQMLAAIEARAAGHDSMAYVLARLAAVLPARARFRDFDMTSAGSGSLTIVSGDRIEPVKLLAATGLLTVTEVNEMNGLQEADHVYAMAFKTVLPVPNRD